MARTDTEDVFMSEILCRLRVKCLKRFQCVCKSWYALISHPSFVAKHLRRNKYTHSFLFSTSLRYNGDNTGFSLVNLDETTGGIVSVDWIKLLNNSEFRNDWYKTVLIVEIFGPRNGIYCLKETSEHDNESCVIALMNFSQREFKVVPKPEESIIWHTGFVSAEVVEIGYDPNTNDYKVFFYKNCSYVKEGLRQAAVYHLNSNSWKKLSDPLLDHVAPLYFYGDGSDTYVNGNVHWLVYEDGGHNPYNLDWYILSFDMVSEVFARIELPADLRGNINRKETSYVVAAFNGYLSLIVYYPITGGYDHFREAGYSSKHFEKWIMNKYGNGSSWTKEFTTGAVEYADSLQGFWRNGEFLIEHAYERGHTISYDPSTQKMEQLCIREGLGLQKSLIYSESLVSVLIGNENARTSGCEIVIEEMSTTSSPSVKKCRQIHGYRPRW